MLNSPNLTVNEPRNRPWDARLARRLVTPLKDTWVTPNFLTTVRLLVGLAAAAAFVPGSYLKSNMAALLLVISNFLDHTDGELARLSGKSSRFGHLYDIASDALVTVLLFVAIGTGISNSGSAMHEIPPLLLGAVAGVSVSMIFYVRMRIEKLLGKSATRQISLGGFETEDVLYLLPLATIFNALPPLLLTAAVVAPLFALWVCIDYRRVSRRERTVSSGAAS